MQPRISAFPKCYIDDIANGAMDLFEWIRDSEGLGAAGLELLYPAFFRSTELEHLRRVRDAIEASDRVVSLLCYSPDFTHPDATVREDELHRQLGAIDAAAALGAECCRVLSGQAHPEVSRQDGVRWVIDAIRAVAPHAAERGVTLAIENHFKDGFWTYREFAQRSDVFLEIVEQIDVPCFGVQFDPSNALVAGEDPLALLERVKHRVVSMHASDRHLEPGASIDDMRQADGTLGYPQGLVHGVVGEGLNDYDAILSTLASIGFHGWISIEDGMNGMDEMQRSLRFLERKVAEHFR
jgi:sugar phosphate isomerase/epimerase